jgi:hypothetical protein
MNVYMSWRETEQRMDSDEQSDEAIPSFSPWEERVSLPKGRTGVPLVKEWKNSL